MRDLVQEVLHLYLLLQPGLLSRDLISEFLLLISLQFFIVLQLTLPVINLLIRFGDVLLCLSLLATSLLLPSRR